MLTLGLKNTLILSDNRHCLHTCIVKITTEVHFKYMEPVQCLGFQTWWLNASKTRYRHVQRPRHNSFERVFFCKSGHCALIVEVKENKKQDQFSYWYCTLINMDFSKVGFLLLFASLSVASVAPKMVVKCVKNEV